MKSRYRLRSYHRKTLHWWNIKLKRRVTHTYSLLMHITVTKRGTKGLWSQWNPPPAVAMKTWMHLRLQCLPLLVQPLLGAVAQTVADRQILTTTWRKSNSKGLYMEFGLKITQYNHIHVFYPTHNYLIIFKELFAVV